MKNVFTILILLFFSASLAAQGNIGINNPNPDSLAILDIESNSKGVLIPRMTEAERAAIPASADQKGLLVFQTDNNEGFWYYNGTSWEKLGESGGRIVNYNFISGNGPAPISTNAFMSPTTTVTISGPNQKVLVTANRAFGSTIAGGAAGLNIAIGYRIQGSAAVPVIVGQSILGLRVAQNTRSSFGISGIITGLAPGVYEVGMAGNGDTTPSNWNSNEYGYVTAIVFD